MLGDRALVDAVLEDYRTAPIDDAQKALFAFIEKMNAQSNQIRREDVDRVRAAGWSDEAIYDAITVCALFKFYNAWIDATGVHDLPAGAYEMSGKRMAAQGYSRS
ncbi:MAG: peroxidase [Acidobacteria bacterium 13_1_40CM_65_14]|nr:MAG: peroxidase [Acidobacteria bacterium 13_1_40CM_65_14]OLC78091.1 MAG: peroxidase [Acidobacteria bacterium 13_1_40CM_4_65_8]OLE78139.1 MAG: peroxidase [Acidobacteria bacterium 13_1_20CM_2_65_9]